MGVIDWNLIALVPPQTINDLPKTDEPYYVATRDGLFLRKKTMLGACMIPQKTMPDYLANLEGNTKNGTFWYSAPKLPVELMSQALSFFRKVLEEEDTEAELLILFDDEATDPNLIYKFLVPTQITSFASVDSIYEPTDITGNYQLVGSIHSHCSFDAFHSSTDIDDASDFTGLHITIGHVNSNDPSYAAMVSVGQGSTNITFNYAIDTVADIEGINGDIDIPDSWMLKVQPDKSLASIDPSKFPSLPKTFVENWLRVNKPAAYKPVANPIVKGPPVPNYNSKNKKDKRQKPNGKTYSYELQTYLPSHYIHNGVIKNEFFIDAISDVLDLVGEIALAQGIKVVYDLDFVPEEVAKNSETSDEDVRDLLTASDALLPEWERMRYSEDWQGHGGHWREDKDDPEYISRWSG